mgnify:CR=1 FL=1
MLSRRLPLGSESQTRTFRPAAIDQLKTLGAQVDVPVYTEEGVNEAFKNHEAVIVLEDDCVPMPAFMSYMEAGLRKYVNNESISTQIVKKYQKEYADNHSHYHN